MYEQQLQEDLARDYSRNVRPVTKNSDILIVKFGLRLIQILDVVRFQIRIRFLHTTECLCHVFILLKDEKNQVTHSGNKLYSQNFNTKLFLKNFVLDSYH